MTKSKQQKTQKQNKKQKQKPKTKRPSVKPFEAVSQVDQAPVAIGNSVRGSAPQVTNFKGGARVVGRDFCFECKATVAAVTNWSLIGGMPLSPSVLVTSAIKNFAQLYAKFKINKIAFHYITSAPTTQAGDVLFYYERDRNGPFIDFTNNSFLPYVLSDPNTVIGPQWMNHSVMLTTVDSWNSTDYGMTTDLNEETAGSIFFFSKTQAVSSPGYILMDYDISFMEMSVNPRAGILPITRAVWNYVTLSKTAVAVTTSTAFDPIIGGLNPDGSTSAIPSGCIPGDIYKVIMFPTASVLANAAWTNTTTVNLLAAKPNSTVVAITIDDGFTCYALYNGTTFVCYPTLEASKASNNWLVHGVGATVTFNICTAMSYVGSVNNNLQATY